MGGGAPNAKVRRLLRTLVLCVLFIPVLAVFVLAVVIILTGFLTLFSWPPTAGITVAIVLAGVLWHHLRHQPAGRRRAEHVLAALSVGSLIIAAVLIALYAVGPHTHLPGIALHSRAIFRFEVVLAVFYGGLLLLIPVYRAVVSGLLPDEISTRGAKFSATVSASIEDTEATVWALRDEHTRLQVAMDSVVARLDSQSDQMLKQRLELEELHTPSSNRRRGRRDATVDPP